MDKRTGEVLPAFDDLRQQRSELLYLSIVEGIKSPANNLRVISLYLRSNLLAPDCAFNQSFPPVIGVRNAPDKPSQLKVVDQKNHRILIDAEGLGQYALLQVPFAGC